ncbi:MAG: hypothetical protein Q7S95_03235 [bacterium]|nr:hypothetical protein [bacterium]
MLVKMDVSFVQSASGFQPLRFEWRRGERSFFRLLRYAINYEEQPLGIRFDTGKTDGHGHMVALDDLDDPSHQTALLAMIPILHALLIQYAQLRPKAW